MAVFKPLDEEPLMPHNPRVPRLASSAPPALPSPLSNSLKRGITPGEGAIREVSFKHPQQQALCVLLLVVLWLSASLSASSAKAGKCHRLAMPLCSERDQA